VRRNDGRIEPAASISLSPPKTHDAPDVEVGRDPRRTVEPVDAWDGISMALTAPETARRAAVWRWGERREG